MPGGCATCVPAVQRPGAREPGPLFKYVVQLTPGSCTSRRRRPGVMLRPGDNRITIRAIHFAPGIAFAPSCAPLTFLLPSPAPLGSPSSASMRHWSTLAAGSSGIGSVAAIGHELRTSGSCSGFGQPIVTDDCRIWPIAIAESAPLTPSCRAIRRGVALSKCKAAECGLAMQTARRPKRSSRNNYSLGQRDQLRVAKTSDQGIVAPRDGPEHPRPEWCVLCGLVARCKSQCHRGEGGDP